ncbi:MAG: alpha/beta hydrolase [Bacilli bacterium]|nr:alpha/beta hydrolase [Bacilli bacterium]
MIELHNTQVNYIQYGSGKDVILLHGWGQNIEMMKPIGDNLSDKFRITIVDLPGFGESPEPKFPWKLDDYMEMLEELVEKLKIKKPIVIGHSFGGRLAIRYSSENIVEKLVLFGSPVTLEKSPTDLKTKILKKMKTLPGMNKIGEYMKKYIGSRDYKNATPTMRQVLVNTVNFDLSEYIKKIKCPTLAIWGDNDTEARIEDAKLMEKTMLDCGLIVLHGTHYAYLENLNQVVSILRKFL